MKDGIFIRGKVVSVTSKEWAPGKFNHNMQVQFKSKSGKVVIEDIEPLHDHNYKEGDKIDIPIFINATAIKKKGPDGQPLDPPVYTGQVFITKKEMRV
jgi:hypothetical protein